MGFLCLTEVSGCIIQHARTSRTHLEHRIIFKSIEPGRRALRASYSSTRRAGNTASSGQVETLSGPTCAHDCGRDARPCLRSNICIAR
jgi:hypothetical protein